MNGYVALIAGDMGAARRDWEAVRRCTPTDLVVGNTGPCAIAVFGELANAFGTDNDRDAVYQVLGRYRDLFGAHPGLVVGPIRLYLGKLDLAVGRVDDAACHLDVAAEMCASRGLDAWLARVDIQRARVALAQGDEERAAVLLDRAIATGDAMGLPIIAREVAEVRGRVG